MDKTGDKNFLFFAVYFWCTFVVLACLLSVVFKIKTPDRDEDIAEKGNRKINFQAHPNYGTLLHEKGSFSFLVSSSCMFTFLYFLYFWNFTSQKR